MKDFLKSRYPFIISAFLFLLTEFFIVVYSSGFTGGKFIYLLDDSYIHMSIARNLAENGIWGIMGSGFASCSSSPLWTLVLSALYFVFGYGDLVPFVLNIIFAVLLLFISDLFLIKYKQGAGARVITLTGVVFFSPLTSVVFTGLEHTAFIALFIFLFYLVSRMMMENRINNKQFTVLLVSLLLLISLRYEGMFFVLPLSVYFLLRKEFFRLIAVVSAGILPLAVLGLISVSNGWYFLPSSVMIKSGNIDKSFTDIILSFLSLKGLEQIINYYHIFLILSILLVLLVASYFHKNLKQHFPAPLALMLAVVIFLQAKLARLGYISRYEAYIVTAGILLISIMLFRKIDVLSESISMKPNVLKILRIITVLLLIAVFIPISVRAVKYTPIAIKNIYEQQYQTAQFVSRFYKGKTIAVNDIGAVSLYGGAKTVDLWGLADLRYADALKNNSYTKEFLEKTCREDSVKLIAVYESWFIKERGGIPDSWIPAERWKIPRNIVCGDSIVTFFAQDSIQLKEMKENLSSFHSELPLKVEILK